MITPVGISQSDYIAAIRAGNPTHVKMVFPVQGVTLIDSDIALDGGMNISTQLNPDTDLTLGKAISSEFDVTLVNRGSVRELFWTEEFTVSMGVDVSGTTYWVQLGLFTGERPEKTILVETVQFTAYDRMQLFEREANGFISGFTIDENNPKTVRQIYQALCDYCYGVSDGSSYESTDDALANIMSRSYTELPFDVQGFTCRDLLSWIAEAAGCYAVITPAGKVKLVWYQEHMSDYTLTRNDWFTNDVCELQWVTGSNPKTWEDLEDYTWAQLSAYLWRELEGQEVPFKVNTLKVSRTDVTGGDDVGVYIPDSSHADNIYQIVDNPFLATANSTEETAYLLPLFNRLNKFGYDGVNNHYVPYIPMNVNCIGNWLIEAGDVINVQITAGSYGRLPIFCRSLRWASYCDDNYVCTGNLKRESITESNKQLLRQGGRYHIYKKDINTLYSEIGDRTGKSTTISQDINNIELRVAETVATYRMPTDPRLDSSITLVDKDIWIDNSYVHAGAAAYDSTATYSIGDYCTYDSKVYVCTVNITTAEAFDPAHWNEDDKKNLWYQYDETNDAWIPVNDNTVYKRQSGIEIVVDGVTISGNKYVKVENNDDYWLYDSHGLTYYAKGKNAFRFGALTSLAASSFSGVFDYQESYDSSINRYRINSTTLYSTNYQTGGLYVRYLHWFVKNIDNSYRGQLVANTTGCYLGSSDNPWAKVFAANVTAKNDLVLAARGNSNNVALFKDGTGMYFGPYDASYPVVCGHYDVPWVEGYFTDIYYSSYMGPPYSSRKYKHDIKSIESCGDRLDKLRAVTFVYNNDKENKQRQGFIYEETIDVFPEICYTTREGRHTLSPLELIPYLLKEIQDLRKRVAELENKEEKL